jgi:anthranilate phosphoribosyltransferase
VVLNAAGALYVAGKGESLPEAIALAEESLDSGAALRKLKELKEASNSVT